MAEFREAGAEILSPLDNQIVDERAGFPYVAGDRARSPRMVEDRHLAAIRSSTLAWLVCPDGEIGLSSAMEVGFARAANTPVFTKDDVKDVTLQEYVQRVGRPLQALDRARGKPGFRPDPVDALLLDPESYLADIEYRVDQLRSIMEMQPNRLHGATANRFYRLASALGESGREGYP